MSSRRHLVAVVALAAGLSVAASADKPADPKPADPKPAAPTADRPWANKLFLPDVAAKPDQPAPPTVEHDFGNVPKGTVCAHTFTLTNVYDVPIQVMDVRPECGCIKATPPNRVLQPNEAADFTVTMDAGAFTGANAKSVFVTVGPNFVSTAQLRLVANSRADVTVSPGRVDFGVVAQGQAASKTVTVRYEGKQKDWRITGESAPDGYEVALAESPRGDLLPVEYQVTVSLKADAPAGPLADRIALRTNDPESPVLEVAVAGTVQPPVTVAPAAVQFRGAAAGKAMTAKVMVRSADACTIASVADDGDGISVDTFPAAAQVQVLTVRYEPKSGDPVRKEIALKTSLPGNPTVTLVVEAGK